MFRIPNAQAELLTVAFCAIFYEEELLYSENRLQLDKGEVVAINGLDGYALPKLVERLPYARQRKK